MFAPKSRMEVFLRVVLTVIVLLNALAPTATFALGKTSTDSELTSEAENAVATSIGEQKPLYFDPPALPQLQGTSPEADEPISPIPPKDTVEFTLVADPAVIPADGLVTFTVYLHNNTEQELGGLLFTDLLESGIEYRQDTESPVTFESGSNQVRLAIDSLDVDEQFSFSYTLLITPQRRTQINEQVWLHRGELNSSASGIHLVASAAIAGDLPEVATDAEIIPLQVDGGWNASDQVEIYMEENTVGEFAVVIASPMENAETGPDLQFNLEVFETTTLATDSLGEFNEQSLGLEQPYDGVFSEPAFLEIKLDNYIELNNIPAGQEPYVATYDETHEVWVKVPILETDYQKNSVTVEASHFSTWGAGLGSSLPQNGANVLLFDQPYTSLFTGSSRYSIPIWTPPGRTGMQPDVSLSYSSGTVDGVLGDVQAPWVGVGWNMDAVEVVRKITTDSNGYGYRNDFALTLNGALYQLVRDEIHQNRYYTDQAAFLYVERHNYVFKEPSTENATGEWWEVVTSDGTRYRLGWTKDSEQLALMYGYSCTTEGLNCFTPDGAYASLGYAGIAKDLVAMRWRVDRVSDTHGNYIEYEYSETQSPSAPGVTPFDRESYLHYIRYTGFDNPNSNPSHINPPYEVEFIHTARSTVGDVPDEFNVWDNLDTQLLSEIRVECTTICSINPENASIRTYHFDYSLASAPNVNGTLTLTSMQITAGGYSENGQSIPSVSAPTIRFTYQNKPNRKTGNGDVFNYPRLETIDNGSGGKLTFTYGDDNRPNTSWLNYRVQSVVVDSGISTAKKQTYTYLNPVYTGIGGNSTLGSLTGYTNVTETLLDFNNADAKVLETKHTFGTVGLDIGRELQTDALDITGIVLSRKTNVYVTDNSKAPFPGWNYRYLGETASYIRSGGTLVQTSKSTHYNDPVTGNPLIERTYVGNSLYRKTYYEYLKSDPAFHIFDKVTRVLLVDAANRIYSDTRYHYDGKINQAPTKGDVTLVQRLLQDPLDSSRQVTIDTSSAYDPYGNVKSTRAYKRYGSANVAPSSSYIETTTEYDGLLNTYPTTVINPMSNTTKTDYLFTLGVPYQTKDANQWLTKTSYDGLGRTLSVTPPGLNQPGTWFIYPRPDATTGRIPAPHSVEMQILDTIAGQYRSVWGIYDGSGRMIQTQVDAGNQLLVNTSVFNAQGLVKQQSLPYYSNGTGGNFTYTTGNQFSSTDYDSLGRIKKVTAPGGIVTETLYDGLTTTSIDPNGNIVSRTSDGLGRMLSVTEYSGANIVYSTTTYSYDTADRLIQVQDGNLNITEIDYDWLGRKLSMDDPDMGKWNYEYDSLGNMISQTDALHQRLTFYYDDLNRVRRKVDSDSYTPDTTYTYGTTPGVIGLRTAMSDSSGSTVWNYWNYGRAVQETRTISGETHTVTSDSDWLGRPLSTTYDDGEIITYEYDNLGRPYQLNSDQTTLVDIAYNVLGQIEMESLGAPLESGNGILIQNTYDSNTNRLQKRNAVKGSSSETLLDLAYVYDINGNITRLTDKRRVGIGMAEETQFYQYDFLNRLTSAVAGNGVLTNAPLTPDGFGQQFEYDKVGNMLKMSNWGTPPTPAITPTLVPTQTPSPTNTAQFTDTTSPTSSIGAAPIQNFYLAAYHQDGMDIPHLQASFPANQVLDNFDRSETSVGDHWSGETNEFSISSDQLLANTSHSLITWNAAPFGVDQEAYITFSDLNTSGASEQVLILKSQGTGSGGDARIEVSYFPGQNRIVVWTYDAAQGWLKHGDDILNTFDDGDQLGAWALANGAVEIYKNTSLIASRDITNWPHYADDGYIGLGFYSAQNAQVDNFGGGDVSTVASNTSTASATPTVTETPDGISTLTSTPVATNTPPGTSTPSSTPITFTSTATRTPSRTPTASSTPTITRTPTLVTYTSTSTRTATNTATPSSLPTSTSSATSTPTMPVGLKAWWSFDGVTGTTAPDVAPSDVTDNVATLKNNADTRYDEQKGNVLYLDGIDDYAVVGDSVEIRSGDSFTVSAWINPSSVVTSRTQYILHKGTTATILDYAFMTTTTIGSGTVTPTPPANIDANGKLIFRVGNINPGTIVGPVLPPNTWTLVTGVYDETNLELRLYINGSVAAVERTTANPYTSSSQLTLGGAAPNQFDGKLDDVRFYNRALADWEVSQVYRAFTPSTPTATSSPTSTATATSTPTHTPTSLTPEDSPTPVIPTPTLDMQWGTGHDGDLLIGATATPFNMNVDKSNGRTCADAAAYSVMSLGSTVANLNAAPASGCLQPDDEVLLINLLGNSSINFNKGVYEFLRVDHISGNSVYFRTMKTHWYGDTFHSDLNIGTGASNQRVMLMRVPNYANVTLDGTITANAFDGSKYGVIAYRVSGNLHGESSGIVLANSLGLGSSTGYGKGGDAAFNQYGMGGNGGGAGYGATGIIGAAHSNPGGAGGAVYGSPDLNQLFLGSGGGKAGVIWEQSTCGPYNEPCSLARGGPPGSNGGGIIFIAGHTIQFAGNLVSSGADITTNWTELSGGAGSGGSVRIEGKDIILETLSVSGGSPAAMYGKGGHGRIAIYYSNSLIIDEEVCETTSTTYCPDPFAPPTQVPQPTAISLDTPPFDKGTGVDGDLLVQDGITFNLNTDQSGNRLCADAVAYSVIELHESWAKLSAPISSDCLAPDDEMLLIKLSESAANRGNAEFLHVGGIAQNIVYFKTPKTLFYGDMAESDANIGISTGDQRVMLMRVPNYTNVTLEDTSLLKANAYDGSKYGVIAFRVSGKLEGAVTSLISADQLGSPSGTGFGKGGNAPYNNFGASGDGGGAGYATTGVAGLSRGNNAGGTGGAVYGDLGLIQLYLGSGGGAASKQWEGQTSNSKSGPQGGKGGGIIYIVGVTIDFPGSILSRGQNKTSNETDMKGGAGSGGSIYLLGSTLTLGTLSVAGGSPADATGKGGNGRVAIYYTDSFTNSETLCADTVSYYCENTSQTPTAPAIATSVPAVDAGIYDDSNSAWRYTGSWSTYLGGGPYNNTLHYSSTTGNYAEVTFNGVKIKLTYLKAAGRGSFDVYIDNVKVTTLDANSSTTDWQAVWTSATLTSGVHTVRFQNAGGRIDLDALQVFDPVTAGMYDDIDSAWSYTGTWLTYNGGGPCNNTLHYSSTTGDSAEVTFNGNQVKLTYLKAAGRGNMVIYIDNVLVTTLNTYSATTLWQSTWTSSVLSPGIHTIRFQNAGGGRIDLDAVDVFGSTVTTPTLLPPGWYTNDYTYNTEAPHAVESLAIDETPVASYEYDANGNMTCRTENGITYKQEYNAENRISAIHKMNGDCSGAAAESWLYVYDGDGVRVSTAHFSQGEDEPDLTTRYFFGGALETSGGSVKKYYAFAGQMVAMKDAQGFKYFLSDHLGSTAMILDENGGILEQQRYLPFGAARPVQTFAAIAQTDLTYTGQRNLSGTGLMDYKARFYSPYINHFLQPDTIIPSPASPQSWNRYSYVLNNPINASDPSGHKCVGEVGACLKNDGSTGAGFSGPNLPAPGNGAGSALRKELEKKRDELRKQLKERLALCDKSPLADGCRPNSSEEPLTPLGVPPNLRLPLSELDSGGPCMDIYVYAMCASITADTVHQVDSSWTMLPTGLTAGSTSLGSAGINYDGSLTVWLGAQVSSKGPVTSYTRLGMQGTPFSLSPARIAGESVVSLRDKNTVFNIRARLTIESRPQNQLNAFAAWNMYAPAFAGGYMALQGCRNPLVC